MTAIQVEKYIREDLGYKPRHAENGRGIINRIKDYYYEYESTSQIR